MYIWLALLIPIIAIIFLYIFFRKNIAWWETPCILLIVIAFIAIMKFSTEKYQVSDTEYIQDYTVEVRHYDEWDEWITQTCTRRCCCTTNSKGEETCSTETYDCSYRDYHSEYWVKITARGDTYTISKEEYYALMRQFNGTEVLVDMHRDYYTIDGDMQYFVWDKQLSSVDYTTYFHTYENRVQAAHSVLNFPEVDTLSIRELELKEYPEIDYLVAPALLGDDNKAIDRYLNQINALYATEKQVKVFCLVFKDQPLEAALKQEQYWKGGNKNEVNICIGIDKNRNIKWSYVFSWTKKDIVKIKIRDYVNSSKVLNDSSYLNIINFSSDEIRSGFERRHFREFSYLTVEPSSTAVIWTYVISFILTVGMCIFAINNPFDADGNVSYNNRYDSVFNYRRNF